MNSIISWNDYNQLLVPLECFDVCIEIAECCIPRIWCHMCHLRNVAGKGIERDKKLKRPRERQVLMQIFALCQMRDKRELKWWYMVLSVAYYGWGVGKQVLDATNKFGIVVLCRSRDVSPKANMLFVLNGQLFNGSCDQRREGRAFQRTA